MLDLTFADQVFDRAGDFLDRNTGIDSVLIKKIDDIGLQALERLLGDLSDPFRAAIESLRTIPILETKLGRDDHFVSEGRDRLADDLFVFSAVGLRSIEEGDSLVIRSTDEADR